MTPLTERNKRRVLAYVKAMGSTAAPEDAFRHVAKNFRLSGGVLTGDLDLEQAKAWRRGVHEAFPDMRVCLGSALVVAEKDTVAVRLRWTATHLGPYLGIPATGRRVDVSLFAFFRIRNGLIDRETHLTDSLALVEQLKGTIPAARPGTEPVAPSSPDLPVPAAACERFYVPPQNLEGLLR